MTTALLQPSAIQAGEKSEAKRLKKTIRTLQRRVDRLEKQIAATPEATRSSAEESWQVLPAFSEMLGPIASSGRSVTKRTRLKVGQVLQVQEQQQWWAARVLRARRDGKVRIRYVGWGSEYDETVVRSRLQLDRQTLEQTRKAAILPWDVATAEFVPFEGTLASLVIDQKILVEWAGQWWPAAVLSILPHERKARIHYTGWEPRWDENVPASRIRTVSPKRPVAPDRRPRRITCSDCRILNPNEGTQ
jgi:hypothetical protein